MFRSNLTGYRYCNLAFLVVAAGLAAYSAWRLSGRKIWVALGVGILLTTSRFAYFNVATAVGVIEGAALLLLMACVTLTVLALETGRRAYLHWALLSFAALILTHERFLGVALFVSLAYWFAGKGQSRWLRFAQSALPVGIVASNAYYRSAILRTDVLVRSPGRPLDLDPSHVTLLLGKAAANLVGFNNGPEHLSGLPFQNIGFIGLVLGGLFTGLLLVVGSVFLVRRRRGEGSWALAPAVVLLALLVATAGSASILIGQEHRFLTAPFAAVLLLFALGTSSLGNFAGRLAGLGLLSLGLAISAYYRPPIEEHVYFFQTLRFADSARDRIDNYPASRLTEVLFVTQGDALPRTWYFSYDSFFRIYGNPRIQTKYIANVKDIPSQAWTDLSTVILAETPGGVIDLKARFPRLVA